MLIKVSVCVPVYKAEKYIERCARSLFDQTMRDGIEFIFVDDGSPDNSLEIVRRVLADYPNRAHQVGFVRHETNRGRVAARWSGIRVAKGDFITHCDSDDSVDPELYERMYGLAESEGLDAVVSPIKEIWMTGREVIHDDESQSLDEYIGSRLASRAFNSLANKLISRRAYGRICDGGDVGIFYGEDLLLVSQLLMECRNIGFIHDRYYNYYRNPESGTVACEDDIAHARQWVQVARLLGDVLSRRYPNALDYLRHDGCIKLLRTLQCPEDEFNALWPESRTWQSLAADVRLAFYKKLLILCCSRHYATGLLIVRLLLRGQKWYRKVRNGART